MSRRWEPRTYRTWHVRQAHMCSSAAHNNPSVLPLLPVAEYNSMAYWLQAAFRRAARSTLDSLDQQAAEERRSAHCALFGQSADSPSPSSHSTGVRSSEAGSSEECASPKRSPKPKRKRSQAGWSPDSDLPSDHPCRDGTRASRRLHVGLTPPRAKPERVD